MARMNNNRNQCKRFPIEVALGSTPRAVAAIQHLLATKSHPATQLSNNGTTVERSKPHEQTN